METPVFGPNPDMNFLKSAKIRKNPLYMAFIWGYSGTLHRVMRPQGVPMDHPNTLGFDFDEYIKTPYKGLAATYISRFS